MADVAIHGRPLRDGDIACSIGDALIAAPFVSFTLALLASVLRDRRRAGIVWVVFWAGLKMVQLASLQYGRRGRSSCRAFGVTHVLNRSLCPHTIRPPRDGRAPDSVHASHLHCVALRSANPVASSAYLIVGSLVALTLYGLYTALGRPPLFGSSG